MIQEPNAKPGSVPIPCIGGGPELTRKVEHYAEWLRTHAHTLGHHGLTEAEFYQSGIFRGAIERLRGQFAADMREKREFARDILNFMQDRGFIKDWSSAGEANRHDYMVELNNGRLACIELKGCLDGNNTNIFERPTRAQEFIIWSICTNPTSKPRHNVWSGIHTRLSAEIISRNQQVDGAIVWDWFCGKASRPCPKLEAGAPLTEVSQFRLPPPCIYLFPVTIPNVRTNPSPKPHALEDVGILKAFCDAFQCTSDSINTVHIEVGYRGSDTVRRTTIRRNSKVVAQSNPTSIKRS